MLLECNVTYTDLSLFPFFFLFAVWLFALIDGLLVQLVSLPVKGICLRQFSLFEIKKISYKFKVLVEEST